MPITPPRCTQQRGGFLKVIFIDTLRKLMYFVTVVAGTFTTHSRQMSDQPPYTESGITLEEADDVQERIVQELKKLLPESLFKYCTISDLPDTRNDTIYEGEKQKEKAEKLLKKLHVITDELRKKSNPGKEPTESVTVSEKTEDAINDARQLLNK